MSISTQSSVLAWPKAIGRRDRTPFTNLVLKALREYLVAYQGNPDLEVKEFDDLTADSVIANAACKVYAIILKKQPTATGCFVKGADHASDAGSTASDLVQELNASGQEAILVYPKGWAQGTGFTVTSHTTADGSTDSTSGDGPDGFVIIGNP